MNQSPSIGGFAMKSKKDRRFALRVGTMAAIQLVEHGLLDGSISIDGKSEDEARDLLFQYLHKVLQHKKVAFNIVYDYTDLLLKRAREGSKKRDYEFAALFYATYFEHRINRIIAKCAQRKKIDKGVINQMIREVNLRGKCLWLLPALGFKAMSKRYAQSIDDISQIRNYLVHYKWLPANESLKKEQETKVRDAERIVKYLRSFENDAIFLGQRRQVTRIFRRNFAKPS